MIGFGVLTHQAFTASLLGEGLTDFVRRNSETYALCVLVPAYWDLFASNIDPRSRAIETPPTRSFVQYAWLGFLAVGAVVLQSASLAEALNLPQNIITLGEAFVAALVVALYQGWSRGFRPGAPTPRDGRATAPTRISLWYYAGIGLITILIYQGFVRTLVGEGLVEWLQINAEAYAAMLLLPAFFDFVAPSLRRRVPWTWYAFLVLVPLIVATGQLDDSAVRSVAVWLGRTTESFLAAIVISAYFMWWRSGSRGQQHSDPKMADGVA